MPCAATTRFLVGSSDSPSSATFCFSWSCYGSPWIAEIGVSFRQQRLFFFRFIMDAQIGLLPKYMWICLRGCVGCKENRWIRELQPVPPLSASLTISTSHETRKQSPAPLTWLAACCKKQRSSCVIGWMGCHTHVDQVWGVSLSLTFFFSKNRSQICYYKTVQ